MDTFLRLVQVPGPSWEERPIADVIKQEVASLGFQAHEDDVAEEIGGNSGNLIVNIPGNTPGAPSLLFAAHMDTVPLAVGVRPVVRDGVIVTDGTTALGGDNRAGVSEILEAVREVKEHNLPHGDLQLLFTVAEEGGLVGARALDPGLIHSDFAYAVDVFKANQIYTQGQHLLIDPPELDLTPEGVARAKQAAEHAPVIPPEHLRLDQNEKRILDFTTGAMQDIGLVPEFRRIEWAGTDAIALRRKGINAISLGAGENRPHSTEERMEIQDLVNSTRLVRSLIARAAASAAVGGPAGAALALVD
ncbi:MAG: M20/M25/M40 family metallo-hydrolase [Armatimonadetes bacterium]|nr:M20/M25/M40 family metallo-hydrolase [Armatimonadota bacterium]